MKTKNTQYYSFATGILGLVMTLIVPAAPAATTIEAVVNASLVSHPQILGARSRARAANHAITQARADYFPTMSLFALNGREWSKSPAVNARRANSNNITLTREEYRLTVDQVLFAGGRVHGGVKQQRYNKHTLVHQLDADRQDIALQAVEAYLEILRQRELISLAKINIELHESTAAKVHKRVKSGASKRVEDQLAAARLALSKTRKERFEGDYAAAKARYRSVTQLVPADDLVLPQAPVGYLPQTEIEAIARGIHHNPLVASARANVLSTRSAVTVARSNFYPTVLGRLTASDADNLDGVTGPPRNQDAMAAVVVNYDFFSGFRDVGAVREAQELVKDATHNLENIQLNIAERIKTAWANYEASMEQTLQFQRYVLTSQKVVGDYKQLFVLGERQLFNVLDAENETFGAKVSLTNAKYDSLVNLYRIFAAMGTLTDVLLKNEPSSGSTT